LASNSNYGDNLLIISGKSIQVICATALRIPGFPPHDHPAKVSRMLKVSTQLARMAQGQGSGMETHSRSLSVILKRKLEKG
jgi:hypothetical protein